MKKNTKKEIYAPFCSDDDFRRRSFLSCLHAELSASSKKNSPAHLRLLERSAKRFETSSDSETSRLAIELFLQNNARCGSTTISLDERIVCDAREFIHRTLLRTNPDCSGRSAVLLDLEKLLTDYSYGPGANAGSEYTHFVDKIDEVSPSVTVRARPLASMMRKLNPHLWSFDGHTDCEFTVIEGSEIVTVPKNQDIDRTICAEPLMNMCLQLSSGRLIQEGLRAIGLDLTNQQDKNKELARKGSIDGSLATIDLSSASDLISPALIALIWPREWYALFMTVRSEFGILSNGERIKLNMMSTMGNGFTFPMMTLTLLALVYAAQSFRCNKRFYIDFSTTGVFGDDIIVPVTDYENVRSVLDAAGLVINKDKSYAEGPFRESCGGDFWLGEDITPFYVKRLSTDPDIYAAINKIHRWCSKNNTYLPETVALLLSMLSHNVLLVPEWSDPCSGIRSSRVCATYKQWVPSCKQIRRNLDCYHYSIAILIMVGGYINSAFGPRFSFIPRSKKRKIRYKLEVCEMPKGYPHGTDYSNESNRNTDLTYHFFEVVLASYPYRASKG